MKSCLKSLTLLAALPLCFAAMNREAAAEDRFDVKIEGIQFYAYSDTTPSGHLAEYEYELKVDIEGIGSRTIKGKFYELAQKMKSIPGTTQFTNIEKPEKSNRRIKFSAKVRREYTVNGLSGSDSLLRTSVTTKGDLFRESDRSGDDVAYETVAVRSRDFVFYVRVTVIETD